VAALATWHVAHDPARSAAAGAVIPAHARLETYSVLTRMPPPHRLMPVLVAELLDRWFPPDRILVPPPRLSRGVVRQCSEVGIGGGAVYDAVVGLTAAEARVTLLTGDTRAARTYRRLGIDFDLMPSPRAT
jgi:hypothetical protein